MKIKLTNQESVHAAWVKVGTVLIAGAVAGIATGLAGSWTLAPLITWDVAGALYVASTWRRVLGMSPEVVRAHATREDPTRIAADVVLIVSSLASLAAVGAVLADSSTGSSDTQAMLALLCIASVVVAWLLVHTIFALRYAELYYTKPAGGVEFGDTKTPTYADFAYLAFTLGMTYQVSDTTLGSRQFRITALRHALLAYLFGTIIVATTINLVAGLAKG
jgi:uncharacterized membrane protein